MHWIEYLYDEYRHRVSEPLTPILLASDTNTITLNNLANIYEKVALYYNYLNLGDKVRAVVEDMTAQGHAPSFALNQVLLESAMQAEDFEMLTMLCDWFLAYEGGANNAATAAGGVSCESSGSGREDGHSEAVVGDPLCLSETAQLDN